MKWLYNLTAFMGLWMLVVMLNDYVFKLEGPANLMVYGYLTIHYVCVGVSDWLFPLVKKIQ